MPKKRLEQSPFIKCVPSADFNILISGLFRLGVGYFTEPTGVGDLSAGVSEIIKAIKLKNVESTGAKAYRLLLYALNEASARVLLEDYRRNDDFVEQFSDKNIKGSISHALKEEDYYFDDTFLSTPAEHSLVGQYLEDFKIALQAAGADIRLLYSLEDKFKSYYIEAFHTHFSEKSLEFSELTNELENVTTAAYRREQEWKEYHAQLVSQVYEPIFEETFGLRQIYVPLNAYYHRKEEEQEIKVICRIEEELDKWLNASNKKDALRIITGDPGAGKSTIAKVWASKLAQDKRRVVYISLNQVRKSTRPEKVITEFFDKKTNRFKHNPYKLLGKDEHTPILFIFDGLDEWIAEGRKSVEAVKIFILEILHILDEANRGKIILRVLLLSRPIVVQENLRYFDQHCTIYHVLPLYITKDFDENTQNKELLKEDKRREWKALYSKFRNLHFNEQMLLRTKGELAEISAQPLLIYLLTVALNTAEHNIDAESINVNTIYETIINHVYERKYEGGRRYRPTEDLSKEQYFEIMENIACSAWRRGDERTTTQKAIDQQFKEQPKRIQKLWTKYISEDQSSRGVEALLSSFYFQKKDSTSEDALYEFSHKSFGEYLMARYVIRMIRKFSAIYRGDSDEAEDENIILEKWYKQFHYNGFEDYLMPYIRRELESEKETNNTTIQWQEDLTIWFQHLLKVDFTYSYNRKSFRIIKKEEGIMHYTLLNVLSHLAHVNSENLSIDSWEYSTYKGDLTYSFGFNRWLNTITPVGNKTFYSLSIKGSWLQCTFLMNYTFLNTKFSDTYWNNIIHQNVTFAGTSFKKTTLEQCEYRNSSFFFSNLKEAMIIDCKFNMSSFTHAYLNDTIFKNTSFNSTSFMETSLENTSFINVKFHGLPGATIQQFSKVKTLYGSTGLPAEIHRALQTKEYKHLWEKPENL